ncbi:MAG: DUF2058 domain-containing protein [Shewanella sp.]|uniref:DUF2058 domain-containing protein n=1 Tax=Shewanella sp. SNU WT4 TaxID=2590015 RepID=UPI0011299D77|nr:DUF2058 domain-containing protein [Shewanella sp. SNU WT4]QDF67135.1 DUF2058 domain-containing protein [Shewanella sp. SNU WT4]
MANALQEQLLKAGLASKQKARDVKTQQRRQKKAKVDDGSSEFKQQVAEQKLAQAAKDKALNEERFAKAQAQGQVRSLITEFTRSALTIPTSGDVKFNFTLGTKIYSIYLTEALQQSLLRGQLGIVRYEDKSYLVPHKLAERVQLLVPEWCGYLWTKENNTQEIIEQDDPYADYVIPDDLIW